jgi:hypothetical protein
MGLFAEAHGVVEKVWCRGTQEIGNVLASTG